MGPGTPQSHIELIDHYQTKFQAALDRGEILPVLYPQASFGVFLLILYLLISESRHSWIRKAKLPTFATITLLEILSLRRFKSLSWSVSYVGGVVWAWTILWSATLILFNNPQREFKRIRRRPKVVEGDDQPKQDGWSEKDDSSTSMLLNGDAKNHGSQFLTNHTYLRARQVPASCEPTSEQTEEKTEEIGGDQNSRPETSVEYYWQPFPAYSFLERLNWVASLVCDFRGVGWNFQIPGLAGPPAEVQHQLGGVSGGSRENQKFVAGKSGNTTYYNRRALLRDALIILAIYYMILDICKVVMMRDPYFWTLVDSPAPDYLPQSLRKSALLVRAYRLVVTMFAMDAALQTIFVLAPLFFVGIARSKYLNTWDEPWMYPNFFGGYSTVLDVGLAGWWGGWWHQIFRFGFGAPSAWIIRRYNLNKRSGAVRLLQLVLAFASSGFLHACGSYTQLPSTRPLRGPFLFFILQPLGILMQTTAVHLAKRLGLAKSCPKLLKQAANFIYVHIWFYYTGPLLTDDLARGGVWLHEPVPISPLRGLGFGLKEEGWLCWGGKVAGWHRGKGWWDSGLAL